MTEPMLTVADLHVTFSRRIGLTLRPAHVRAVNGVDLSIRRGEALAVVGESGSGKSTLARAVLRLVPASGSIRFDGRDLAGLSERGLRRVRPQLQMVFQDPYSSLNPMMTVAKAIGEPLLVHRGLRGSAARAEARELLELVELQDHFLDRYPDQLSGGQRQRVAIARAIAPRPSLLVLDEAVSALDVSTQNKILVLLNRLRAELDLAFLFISHNLAVVEHVADTVAVMYLGRVVEQGPTAEVFGSPRHPYTRALLSAVPVPDPRLQRSRERIVLQGEVPSPLRLPSGCPFHTRCPDRMEICRTTVPLARRVGGATVSCHLDLPPASVLAPRSVSVAQE